MIAIVSVYLSFCALMFIIIARVIWYSYMALVMTNQIPIKY